MLNLTLPIFPFVLAFAVKSLGWKPAAIGMAAAIPYVCNALQPLFLTTLSKRLSIYRLLVLTFWINALPWFLVGFLDSFGTWRDGVFALVLFVSTLGNSLAAVAWWTSISELVPERIAGRYFGKRNLFFGAWSLVTVFLAGLWADYGGNTIRTFGWIFALGGLARLIGLFFQTRMKFPASVMERQERGIPSSALWAVFRDKNYLHLLVFIGIWGLLLNGATPFYTVFLVERLGMSVGDVVKLVTVAALGGLLTLKAWGVLCDRFGSRPVLHVCGLVWASTALVMWSLAGPRWHWHLYPGYLVIGSVTAGFQLAQFNLMIRLAPSQSRAAYVGVFLAATSLITAAGPLLSGRLLGWMPEQIGELFGQPILKFHLLFVLSALGCLLSVSLSGRIRESAAQPVEELWREMKSMPSLNPILTIWALGGVLLTPSSLLTHGRNSLRTVRRQVKVLGEVGEEIMDGGKEVIRRPFSTKR